MKRMTLRISDGDLELVRYWASKLDISENEFIREAIDLKVRHVNRDYDLPTAEQQRLNQLIDIIANLSSRVDSLESVVVSGFNSLISLTRGDNYLLDDE